MLRFLTRIFRVAVKQRGYETIVLSEKEIKEKSYKQFLGGGEKEWELRGGFQLFFLRMMGLKPSDRVLDVGCGPIRGGIHILGYLEPEKYHGVDYNKYFLRSATAILADSPLLAAKKPALENDKNFGFFKMPGTFDYILAFSVLNHCSKRQIAFFFRGLHHKLKPTGKVYITHASWFKGVSLFSTQLKVTRTFLGPGDISSELKMEKWGWTANESIFPILELMLVSSPEA